MSVCVPVRSMKNTAEFAELVERERDVTVTKNGCEIFHCLSDEQYRAMRDEMARARLLSRAMRSEQEALAAQKTELETQLAGTEQELEAGAYCDYDDFVAGVREEYGL